MKNYKPTFAPPLLLNEGSVSGKAILFCFKKVCEWVRENVYRIEKQVWKDALETSNLGKEGPIYIFLKTPFLFPLYSSVLFESIKQADITFKIKDLIRCIFYCDKEKLKAWTKKRIALGYLAAVITLFSMWYQEKNVLEAQP